LSQQVIEMPPSLVLPDRRAIDRLQAVLSANPDRDGNPAFAGRGGVDVVDGRRRLQAELDDAGEVCWREASRSAGSLVT